MVVHREFQWYSRDWVNSVDAFVCNQVRSIGKNSMEFLDNDEYSLETNHNHQWPMKTKRIRMQIERNTFCLFNECKWVKWMRKWLLIERYRTRLQSTRQVPSSSLSLSFSFFCTRPSIALALILSFLRNQSIVNRKMLLSHRMTVIDFISVRLTPRYTFTCNQLSLATKWLWSSI